ncbi:HEC/Ndc80p family-domain-containing protein [Spinellus fusiger]|nr:HEC/Ndc80p family-domain-containing protein [Spinellus fusiger]
MNQKQLDRQKLIRRFTAGHAETLTSQARKTTNREGNDALTSLKRPKLSMGDIVSGIETAQTYTTQPTITFDIASVWGENAVHDPIVELWNEDKEHASGRLHKNPRDIKNLDFQREAVKTITDYLNKTAYPEPNPRKLIRGLNNKSFRSIFYFLYNHLMPDMKYQHQQMESEEVIPGLIKILRYPFADSIKPKDLSSIGAPHYLPTLWALLLWMVEECEVKDSLPKESMNTTALRSAYQNPLEQSILQSVSEDYKCAKYNAFMAKEGDDQLQQQLQEFTEHLSRDIDAMKISNTRLFNEIRDSVNKLKQLGDPLKIVTEENALLKTRYTEMQTAKFSNMRQEKHYSSVVKSAKEKLRDAEETRISRQHAVDKYKEMIASQNMTDAESAALANRRYTLENEHRLITEDVSNKKTMLEDYYVDISNRKAMIHGAVSEYNSLCRQAGLSPREAPWARGHCHESRVSLDAHPSEMLSNDISSFSMPAILGAIEEVRGYNDSIKYKEEEMRRMTESSVSFINTLKVELHDMENQALQMKRRCKENDEDEVAQRKLNQEEAVARDNELIEMKLRVDQRLVEVQNLEKKLSSNLAFTALHHEKNEEKIKKDIHSALNTYTFLCEQVNGIGQSYLTETREHLDSITHELEKEEEVIVAEKDE